MSHYFIKDKNLKSDERLNQVIVNDIEYKFFTNSGLFNKKGLDYGTRLLLETVDLSNKKSFLDVGCGCGPIGIYLSLKSNDYNVDMIDINASAIDICKKSIKLNNIKNLNVFLSDSYENVDKKYDCILTNPPIHAGKKVVYNIIENAKDYLNSNGELWVVIRKDQGAQSLIRDMSQVYNSVIVKKSKGFYIIKFTCK